jgi:hypothetical protein
MHLILDDYFLAYSEGKKELTIPLTQPIALGGILAMAKIPAWEHFQLTINEQPVSDLAVEVTDGDEVRILPR